MMKKIALYSEPIQFVWLCITACLLLIFKSGFRKDMKKHNITLKRFRYFSKKMAQDEDAMFPKFILFFGCLGGFIPLLAKFLVALTTHAGISFHISDLNLVASCFSYGLLFGFYFMVLIPVCFPAPSTFLFSETN